MNPSATSAFTTGSKRKREPDQAVVVNGCVTVNVATDKCAPMPPLVPANQEIKHLQAQVAELTRANKRQRSQLEEVVPAYNELRRRYDTVVTQYKSVSSEMREKCLNQMEVAREHYDSKMLMCQKQCEATVQQHTTELKQMTTTFLQSLFEYHVSCAIDQIFDHHQYPHLIKRE